MNEAYNVGFKDGASAGYKLAIEDMKLDKKPQIMKKYEGDYATLLARHNALMEAVHGLLGALANGEFNPTVATDGHVARIAAQRVYEINRAEVDRILSEEK